MALSAKREGVKQVPWFSLTEWHEVYKQIYSNDTTEQNKAYETLLAWKARIPKLPVGIDCTLSILQVCLRDREWTPKIDSAELSISYENDLCLMYSTTIMRILNHISNIGHTKQTSLFQIAQQLNIPEWIVQLRHDAAHGHELPSIGVLRIAINVLLTWLHEEYWAAEAKALEEYYANDILIKEAQEAEEAQAFRDLIELWTAISLYIHAGCSLVSDIPDAQLRDTLEDLRLFALAASQQRNGNIEEDKDDYTENAAEDIKKDSKYKLKTAQIIVLSEISRYIRRKTVSNKEDIIFDALFNTETFLPSADVLPIFQQECNKTEFKNALPKDMMTFWKDIIYVLQEEDMLEPLILRLLKLVNKEDEGKHTRSIASLWISSICYSFIKLDAAQAISRTLENSKNKLNSQILESKVREKTDRTYPRLKSVLWWNLSTVVPHFLTDTDFALKLILNPNEYSVKFIPPLLELVTPKIDNQSKEVLLKLINMYATGNFKENKTEVIDASEKPFTIEDLAKQYTKHVPNKKNEASVPDATFSQMLADQKVRNTFWKLAPGNYNWASCPIGILPWQIDTLEALTPLNITVSKCDASVLESEIIPGIIDSKDLKIQSQINWDNVLRKKKRSKRKYDKGRADIMINRALETIKKQK